MTGLGDTEPPATGNLNDVSMNLNDLELPDLNMDESMNPPDPFLKEFDSDEEGDADVPEPSQLKLTDIDFKNLDFSNLPEGLTQEKMEQIQLIIATQGELIENGEKGVDVAGTINNLFWYHSVILVLKYRYSTLMVQFSIVVLECRELCL